MKLVITARIRPLFDRYWVRITIGVLFSLLVHGLILSLQLGIPGFGLPGLGLPWSERRAQTPELSIRIANLAVSPTVEPQTLPPQLPESETAPKPQKALQLPSNDQPLTDLPNARVKQTPLRPSSNSLKVAKALKSSPALAQALRQHGTPPPDDQSTLAPARSQPELIASTGDKTSSFVVPAPDPNEWWRTAPEVASTPLSIHPPEEAAPPAIAVQTPKPSLEAATEPAPALQKPNQQESFERPDATQAENPTPTPIPDIAMELAARRQGEEIAQQEATHKLEEREAEQLAQDRETIRQEERQQEADKAARLIAAQKQEEEQAARRSQELAAKKLEDAQKQALEDAERQARELEARRQADEIARQQAVALALQKQVEAAQKQAEEIARQKLAALERQKLEEQQAAQQKAQELAARQKADADAAIQRENARMAAAAVSATNASAGSNSSSGAGTQPNWGEAGSLVSKALEDIRKNPSMGIAPPSAMSEHHSEENSQRHSVFGSIDHDSDLASYILGWRTKIERNGNLNYAQSSKDKAREDPVVTVAIRSDGSIKDIIFNRSSGRADLDEAVRRIVRINAPYSVFPASLAQKYDVIPIRRIWNFDERLRVLEEVH